MTRLANRYGAVNLAQGFPDFPAPEEIKRAAIRAIEDDYNQYSITWGTKSLRDSIAKKYETDYGLRIDPESDITVCCGSTEAMMSAMLARTHHHHQWHVQDLQCHRLARRLCHCCSASDQRYEEGARFPHRGRACAAPGSRHNCVDASAKLL